MMQRLKTSMWMWGMGVMGTAVLLLAQAGGQAALARGAAVPRLQAQPTPANLLVVTDDACDEPNARFGSETSHYYSFLGKDGDWYEISTAIFLSAVDPNSVSIDTRVLLYRHNPLTNPGEQPIAQNDDKPNPDPMRPEDRYGSLLNFYATEHRTYWIEVQNLVPQGQGGYCLQVRDSGAPGSGAPDACEYNDIVQEACEIEIRAQVEPPAGQAPTPTLPPVQFPEPDPPPQTYGSFEYNFVPTIGEGPDRDFYKLWVKQGQHYLCQTYALSQGNDTHMALFDSYGQLIPGMTNDDVGPGNKASKLSLQAGFTGWLYVLIEPVVQVDVAYAERYTYYLFCANELVADAPQATATQPDECELNDSPSVESACQVILAHTSDGIVGKRGNTAAKPLNFAPWSPDLRDVDYFRLWSKAGWRYTCRTLTGPNGDTGTISVDTRMTLFYEDLSPVPGGSNDDASADTLLSEVTIDGTATRTGWLLIKVEPVMSFILSEGGKYQYQLKCEAQPPPEVTVIENLNAPGPGTQYDFTRTPDATSLGGPDGAGALANAAALATPTPAAPGGPTTVSFVPLPTAAPTPTPPPQGQPVAFTVHVYFDANDNGVKDADEGIAGLPVYVYTGLLPMPVRAVTTAGGAVYVETETAVGSVQLRVPYLNISQDVAATAVQDVRLRVAAP